MEIDKIRLEDLNIENEYLNKINDINSISGFSEDSSRPFRDFPVCSYNQKHWVNFFMRTFYLTYGESFSERVGENEFKRIFVMMQRHDMTIAYKKVFIDRKWSAREFAKFIIHYSCVMKNNDKEFNFSYFKDKRIDKVLNKYSNKWTKLKEEDSFEREIYVPFYPVSSKGNNDELFAICSDISENVSDDKNDAMIKISFNYGIPIYIRYMQCTYNMKFQEAVDLFKKRFNIFAIKYKDYPERIKDTLDGMLKNSIMWEPYTTHYQRKELGEDNIVFNFRKEMKKIISKFEFEDKTWWREKHQTYKYKIIPSVKKLFT